MVTINLERLKLFFRISVFFSNLRFIEGICVCFFKDQIIDLLVYIIDFRKFCTEHVYLTFIKILVHVPLKCNEDITMRNSLIIISSFLSQLSNFLEYYVKRDRKAFDLIVSQISKINYKFSKFIFNRQHIDLYKLECF